MTIFKKRRQKSIEKEKEIEGEKRKKIWQRIRFKIKIFNIFAKKIEKIDDDHGKLVKLKRKLGGM